MHDVIIAGLGPAGSTAAYRLAKSGFKVLSFDKEKFPRYKSCGGCISAKIDGLIDFDISPCVEFTVKGAYFTYRSGRKLDITADKPVGYNVMRDTFDAFLLNKAKEAGAEVVEGTRVTGFVDKGGHVDVTTSDGRTHSSKFIIGADGAGGVIGREHFGMTVKECAVSITAELPYDNKALSDMDGRLFIDFGTVPLGYGWMFPKKNFLSIGVAGDLSKNSGSIKKSFKELISMHELTSGLRVEDTAGWTVPVYSSSVKSVVKGRALLAGDSGRLVDPFLGEGIYFAMKTATVAADTITQALHSDSANLMPYQTWLENDLFPEFCAAEKVSNLVYNHPRLWYKILENEPAMMLKYFSVIRGEESVRSFHDWVYKRIRSKPWRLLRRWVESKFV